MSAEKALGSEGLLPMNLSTSGVRFGDARESLTGRYDSVMGRVATATAQMPVRH